MTTDITELAQSMSIERIKQIALGGTPTMGEKERLAITALYFSEQLKIATDAFQAAGLAQLAAEEALEKAQQERDEFRNRLKLERSILEDADKRIAELESEVKFPGVMRCNTCGFTRSHVIVTPGGMRAGESVPEHCPNGCGPLWHDTYRRQYNELYDAYKELESRSVKLPKRSVGEVMHMSGFSRDYAEGWCSGNDNAIHEMRAAGIKVEAE